jgi:hypothetical protein
MKIADLYPPKMPIIGNKCLWATPLGLFRLKGALPIGPNQCQLLFIFIIKIVSQECAN